MPSCAASWPPDGRRGCGYIGGMNDIAPPVAIIAFDGMQSHRWAAPPTMSRSTPAMPPASVSALDEAHREALADLLEVLRA